MDAKRKKTVYFVRHGQSVANVTPVFQGTDSPLSDKGIEQAKLIAKRLSHLDVDVLIASPVKRAKQTAEYISEATKHEIIFSDLFVERIKPAETEGKPHTDAAASRLWEAWEKALYVSGSEHASDDCENYDDIVERADEALEYLLQRPEDKIVVVTHGFFLRVLVARVILGDKLTGETMKRFQDLTHTENTAITVLNYEDAYKQDFAWRVWTLNDHSHFAE